ncbi:MAG TPA: hypothetical protein VFT32_12685 [Candidatus Eisenbacteria bacterium]|nr:hypothetical protein [Candidatus Eisenbacteria bacterium]
MNRRWVYLIVLALLVLGVTTTARAVPMLVEFAWTDASGSTDDALRGGGNRVVVPWERDPNLRGHERMTHRVLSLWLSSDGKNWRRTDAQIVNFNQNGLTARLKSSDPMDLARLYGFEMGRTGLVGGDMYVGVSTASGVWTGGFTAKLVSVQGMSSRVELPVPEPAVLPLLTIGALGLGAALLAGRRR